MGDLKQPLLKWVAGNPKIRKKALETATKYAKKANPIVQTLQAGVGTYSIGKMRGNASNVTDKVNNVAAKVEKFIPSMQVMGRSLADSAKIFTYFSSIATAAGIGANIILAYQGVKVLQLIDTRLQDEHCRTLNHGSRLRKVTEDIQREMGEVQNAIARSGRRSW